MLARSVKIMPHYYYYYYYYYLPLTTYHLLLTTHYLLLTAYYLTFSAKMRMKALLHSSSTWGVITREGVAALLEHLGGDNQGRGEDQGRGANQGGAVVSCVVVPCAHAHPVRRHVVSSRKGVIPREGVSSREAH